MAVSFVEARIALGVDAVNILRLTHKQSDYLLRRERAGAARLSRLHRGDHGLCAAARREASGVVAAFIEIAIKPRGVKRFAVGRG